MDPFNSKLIGLIDVKIISFHSLKKILSLLMMQNSII